MTERVINVLFLCTHNSARSILAEATLNHMGQGRFKAFSAGSSPRENQQPNPLALKVLADAGIATDGLRSKSWDEFGKAEAQARRAGPPQASDAPSGGSALHEVKSVGAPPLMDLVITVCDNAAGEVCPWWPGAPATAHWRYPDPSTVPGGKEAQLWAFRETLQAMRERLEKLVSLPPEKLGRDTLLHSARELASRG